MPEAITLEAIACVRPSSRKGRLSADLPAGHSMGEAM